MVTLFNGTDIKVEVANVCVAMDTLIDQEGFSLKVAYFHQAMMVLITMGSYVRDRPGDVSDQA